MKIGIMLPNWIGDVAMATPTLRALRQQFADAELIGVIRPYAADVLAGTPWLDKTLTWEHHGSGSTAKSWRMLWELRREKIDTWLVLRNSCSSALMARLSGARRLLGYAYPFRSLLLTDRLQPPREGKKLLPISAVDYYLQLAELLGCQLDTCSKQLQLATLPADEIQTDQIWQRLRLPDGDQVVGLNLGGAYGSAKRWPTSHGVELASRLARESNQGVLILCGPNERESTRELVRQVNHPLVQSLADQDLSIGLSKACIARLRLLVTTDSGPRHLAAGLGTPTITLFGSTDPIWGENYQTAAVKLRLSLECSPCGKRVCPLGHHRCMQDLSVQQVFQTVMAQIAAEKTSQPKAA